MTALACAVASALCQPAVQAQTKKPEEPAAFEAMETPGSPATLATPPSQFPGSSLITPPTGVVPPSPGFTGSKVVMTQRVWQDYVKYLRNDVVIGYGLFMVTADGRSSYVKQCGNYACQISPVTRFAALDECAAQQNRRCVVFAEGRDIKYAYEVVP